MSQRVIYILKNPMYWNMVKIGYTQDIRQRLQQLNSSTAVPVPYQCYAVYEVIDMNVDKKLHQIIDKLNPFLRVKSEQNGHQREREFYTMTEDDAYGILECIAIISGTTDRLHRTYPDGTYMNLIKPVEASAATAVRQTGKKTDAPAVVKQHTENTDRISTSNITDITGSAIERYSFQGTEYQCSVLSDMLSQIVTMLHQCDSNVLNKLYVENMTVSGKCNNHGLLVRKIDDHQFRRIYQVPGTLYVINISLSGKDCMRYIQAFLREYNIPAEAFSVDFTKDGKQYRFCRKSYD